VLPGAGAVSRVEDSALAAAFLYQYDALGRPASRSIESFVGGNWVDDNHSVSWQYDPVSRLTAMTNVLGEFEYEYDQPAKGLSRLAAVTYPNGQKTEYDWHPAAQHHRLAAITHRKGDETLISSYGYAFSKGGQLRTWTQKVGADPLEHWQIEHDEAEQLRSVIAREGGPTGTILRQQFYNYDPAGNRTGYQDGHSIRPLAYNHLNQIIDPPTGGPVRFEGTIDEPGTVSINEQSATMRTVLDANEDPTFRFSADVPLTTGLNQVTVEAVDGSSNITSELYEVTVTELTGQTAPDYDSRGNMTSNGRGQSYEWDALNRLLAIEYADDSRTEFTYDALSRRIRIVDKDEQGDPITDKRLLWEGTSIVQERNAQNQIIKRYEEDGLALSDNSTYFYTRDHLGSIRQVTDEDEAVVEHYRYDPYGVQTASAPGGPNNSRLADFRYTGHYHHEQSSLHLAMFRAYDVELGVWISEDPLGEEGGINLYGYVEGNPVHHFDSLGLEPDINLLNPGDNTGMYASECYDPPDTLTVVAHGSNRSISRGGNTAGGGKRMNAKQFYKEYRNLIDASQKIRLAACNTGNTSGNRFNRPTDYPFAQQLADISGKPVEAGDTYGWIMPGDPVFAPPISEKGKPSTWKPDLSKKRPMITFQPQCECKKGGGSRGFFSRLFGP
jgi:RHS repeat-associated protein